MTNRTLAPTSAESLLVGFFIWMEYCGHTCASRLRLRAPWDGGRV